MNWFTRWFTTDVPTADGVATSQALEDLAASNQVVAGEVAEFRQKRTALSGDIKAIAQQAERSAQLLSGYGIAVQPSAFLDLP